MKSSKRGSMKIQWGSRICGVLSKGLSQQHRQYNDPEDRVAPSVSDLHDRQDRRPQSNGERTAGGAEQTAAFSEVEPAADHNSRNGR